MTIETQTELEKLLGIAYQHEHWRKGCINLVAAEKII